LIFFKFYFFLGTEARFQTSICKQGLNTILSHCGVIDNGAMDNDDHTPEYNNYGSSVVLDTSSARVTSRIHEICSRILSNLTKNSKNRNHIYKAELSIRTNRTLKMKKEMMKLDYVETPRRPLRPPSSVASSPRVKRIKKQFNGDDDDDKEKKSSVKDNFMKWYNTMGLNKEGGEENNGRLSRLSESRNRNVASRKKNKKITEDCSNPLLIREMRRPLSSMYSPSVKRPMPQTEFTRDTVTPSSFGASIGFGRPASQMSDRLSISRMTTNSRMSNSSNTTFTEYNAYNNNQWNDDYNYKYYYDNNSGSIGGIGSDGRDTSMTMFSTKSSMTDWNIDDEMDQVSQYLPPLADIDICRRNDGGQFCSPFSPAVANISVKLNYDNNNKTMLNNDEEEENDDADNKNDDVERDISIQQDDGEIVENENQMPLTENKKQNELQYATEHSIVLEPATPRNTMKFGGKDHNQRSDDPNKRETRLWSFTHVSYTSSLA
jgi:hypothetical protein